MNKYDHQTLVRLLAIFNYAYEDSYTEDERDYFANTLVLVLDRLTKTLAR